MMYICGGEEDRGSTEEDDDEEELLLKNKKKLSICPGWELPEAFKKACPESPFLTKRPRPRPTYPRRARKKQRLAREKKNPRARPVAMALSTWVPRDLLPRPEYSPKVRPYLLCPVCREQGGLLRSDASLVDHLRSVHMLPLADGAGVSCLFHECDMVMDSLREWRLHNATEHAMHELWWAADESGVTFTDRGCYEQHRMFMRMFEPCVQEGWKEWRKEHGEFAWRLRDARMYMREWGPMDEDEREDEAQRMALSPCYPFYYDQ